jgi:aminoglycoside/choline kinase family phosphotransferase
MTPQDCFEPEREAALRNWLAQQAPRLRLDSLQIAASDASPRRYWRVWDADGLSHIVMDAPVAHNETAPFLDRLGRLQAAGLRVPHCSLAAPELGFLLLADLGDQTFLPALKAAQAAADLQAANGLMRAAIASLVQLQAGSRTEGLPVYDAATIEGELALFPEWCVAREFGQLWGEREQRYWAMACKPMVAAFAEQPQVLVHCDYMPRNLMLPGADGRPGLLDFQDALHGPAGYDLASLLRDAFISWDEEQELDWAVRYWEQARAAGIAWSADFGDCWRLIEWTALQRHLRILGVFCRLKHRDGKPRYLEDLPRFLAYATKTAARYRELSPLLPLLEALRPGLTQTAMTLR